jgi:hypothetical protein
MWKGRRYVDGSIPIYGVAILGYRRKPGKALMRAEVNMVALRVGFFDRFRRRGPEGPAPARDSAGAKGTKEAFDFSRRVYNETGGPTPELRRLYMRYLENQGDLKQSVRAGKATTKA